MLHFKVVACNKSVYVGCSMSNCDNRASSRERKRDLQNASKRSPLIMATMSGGTNLEIPGINQSSSVSATHRKKDSSPSARFWESPDTLAQLEVVRQWIGKHYKKVVS